MALVSKTRKGKGKDTNKKGNSEGEAPHPGKKKDLSKIKCFLCHKMGHYASKYLEEKKGKEKTQKVAATTKTQKDDFAEKFEKEFSLISSMS